MENDAQNRLHNCNGVLFLANSHLSLLRAEPSESMLKSSTSTTALSSSEPISSITSSFSAANNVTKLDAIVTSKIFKPENLKDKHNR